MRCLSFQKIWLIWSGNRSINAVHICVKSPNFCKNFLSKVNPISGWRVVKQPYHKLTQGPSNWNISRFGTKGSDLTQKKVQNWHKKGADLTQKGANLTKSPQNGLQILPNFLTFPNLKWLIRPTPLRLFSSTQQIEFIMKNIWNEI